MSVIRVTDVYKKFKVYYDKGSTLKEKALFKNRNRYEDRWVLKGISFELEKGEAIGLIGENGCGKSTMLKMLSRIMYPDKGEIEVNGRVSSLIELGAGFHPDMSGRENIYTNAAIFGLTKKEIDERLDEIIEFSELGEFIDNPVRTYSSGMYMRLAFSVAINVDADVLLIDEILAVGDANFQAKCFGRLRELKDRGVTIVIVTHDTNTVSTFCNQAIWISDGQVRASGKAKLVVDQYLQFMNRKLYEAMQRQQEAKEKADREAREKERAREKAREKLFTVCCTIHSDHERAYKLHWETEQSFGNVEIKPGDNAIEFDLNLKPGDNILRYETKMPHLHVENDPRNLCFQVINYELRQGRCLPGKAEVRWGDGVYDKEKSVGGYWRWMQNRGEIIFSYSADDEAKKLREEKSEEEIRPEDFDRTAKRYGLKTSEIIEAGFYNEAGDKLYALREGEDVKLVITYHVNEPSSHGYVFGAGIYTMDYECVYGINTGLDGKEITSLPSDGRVTLNLHDLPLLAGKYILQVAIENSASVPLDYCRDYLHFDVISDAHAAGTTMIKHDWIIE